MFASNSELIITGDSKLENQVSTAVELLLKAFDFRPVEFQILNDGRAILHRRPSEIKSESIFKIEKNNCNTSYITTLIHLYLSSSEYNTAMRKIPQTGEDGSHYSGWRMELNNTTIDDKIIIEPWWAFYHK